MCQAPGVRRWSTVVIAGLLLGAAGCGSGSSGPEAGINAAMDRVERAFPAGVECKQTKAGGNFRIRSCRLPQGVDAVVASIRARHGNDAELGPPSFDASGIATFWIKGDAHCDGRYFVTLKGETSQTQTAEMSGNCED